MNKFDEAISFIESCKSYFERIKNNCECENFVFKKSFRMQNECELFLKYLKGAEDDKTL